MDIIVSLTAATLCWAHQCYPALVGVHTLPGTYPVIQRYTDDPGYGGDVLKYDETPSTVYAIHRVWTLKPQEHRRERLASPNPKDRQNVTNGCINVDEVVYNALVQSCKEGCRLIIQK